VITFIIKLKYFTKLFTLNQIFIDYFM